MGFIWLENKERWLASVNAVIKPLGYVKCGGFVNQLMNLWLSGMTAAWRVDVHYLSLRYFAMYFGDET